MVPKNQLPSCLCIGLVMKGVVGVVISLGYLSLLIAQRPFANTAMNTAEVYFVNAEIAVILFGILYTSNEEKFAESAFLEILQLIMLLTVYCGLALYMNIQFLRKLFEKHMRADSASSLVKTLWGKEDAEVVKRVLLHRMVPGIWVERLKALKKMRDDPDDVVQQQGTAHLKTNIDMCIKLEGMFSDTHALSYMAHDTFYHDLVRKFPCVLGWILFSLSSASTSEFERDEGIIL